MAVDKAARSEKIALIVKYIQLNRGQHSFYFLKYVGCEILNFVNVVGQMFFMDMFLGYEFSTYGLDVINYSEMEVDERPDPLAVVFPKVRSLSSHDKRQKYFHWLTMIISALGRQMQFSQVWTQRH